MITLTPPARKPAIPADDLTSVVSASRARSRMRSPSTGVPVAIDGVKCNVLQAISQLNTRAGNAGVGRLDAQAHPLSQLLTAQRQRLAERLGKKSVTKLSGKGDETLTTDNY